MVGALIAAETVVAPGDLSPTRRVEVDYHPAAADGSLRIVRGDQQPDEPCV